MKFIADFHLHSKYSRATSKQMDVANLAKWAKIKGIKILGSSDFTHPQWLKELKQNLEPAEAGLLKLKKGDNETRFILTSEISTIYSKGNRTRKIHNLIFAPSFKTVESINTQLSWIGNLKADGRPILGLDAKELLKIVLDISEDCLVVPAHLMTPWFSLFGSNSGFDSIEECFEDYSKYIFAGETGLSASPAMLWRMSDGRKITLISNSDAHSPAKLGREANVFNTELNYPSIISAIKNKQLLLTIEFFPEEGKYHFDGHRNCNMCLSPQETKRANYLCPKCHRPLTIGVMHRVDKLADRNQGSQPQGAVPFKNLIPLQEIIGEALGIGPNSKGVAVEYQNLIRTFGNEFRVLLDMPLKDLEKATQFQIAEGIKRTREGKVHIEPGYDGEYGKIRIFERGEQKKLSKQTSLF